MMLTAHPPDLGAASLDYPPWLGRNVYVGPVFGAIPMQDTWWTHGVYFVYEYSTFPDPFLKPARLVRGKSPNLLL